MTDQSIVDLYWSRDERALVETQSKYGSFCLNVAMNILANHADAEECVNDTYLRAWNSIPPSKPASLRAFLGKIARRLSIDRYRQRHAACRNESLTVALEELAACLPSPEEVDTTLPSLLEEFLLAEESLDRKLFMGRYWHSYPIKDLARHYAMSPNAVTKRLARSRDRLRAYLTERGYRI